MVNESEKVRARLNAGCADLWFRCPLNFGDHRLAKVVEESEQNFSFASAGGGRWLITSSPGHGWTLAEAAELADPTIDPIDAAERLTALVEGLSERWLSGSITLERAQHLLAGAITAELG